MADPLPVAGGIRKQIHGVRGLAQSARDHAADHERQAPAPVVANVVELVKGAAGLPVSAGEVAEFGRRECLDRAQRADRPLFADAFAKRQERVGQPAGLVQSTGQQPRERGRAAQPGPTVRVPQFGKQPRRASEGRIGRREIA